MYPICLQLLVTLLYILTLFYHGRVDVLAELVRNTNDPFNPYKQHVPEIDDFKKYLVQNYFEIDV